MALIGKRTTTTLGFGVDETLESVNARVIELQSRFNATFAQVEEKLNQGIDLMRKTNSMRSSGTSCGAGLTGRSVRISCPSSSRMWACQS